MIEVSSASSSPARHHAKHQSVDFGRINQSTNRSSVSLPPLHIRPISAGDDNQSINQPTQSSPIHEIQSINQSINQPNQLHIQQSVDENTSDNEHAIEIIPPHSPDIISPIGRKEDNQSINQSIPLINQSSSDLISPSNRSGIRLSNVPYPSSPKSVTTTIHSSRLSARISDRRTTSTNQNIVIKAPFRLQSNPLNKSKSPSIDLTKAQLSTRENSQVRSSAAATSNDMFNKINAFGLDLDGRHVDDVGKDETSEDSEKHKSEATNEHKASSLFSSFSAHLHLFSYVLLLAGLRQNTSRWYRNWLRVVTYGCAILCALNIGFQTKSYRNILFDVTLTLLHIVVSVSYEFWLRYCRSKEWRVLCAITVKVNSAHFARHIRLLGWFGLVMVTGATIVIAIGWEIPIFAEIRRQFETGSYSQDGPQFAFLLVHAIFMAIIIAPWAAVCMCSVCLFKLVILAHQSDIEYHFVTMKTTLVQSMETLAHGHRVDAEQLMKAALAAGEPGTPNSHRKGPSAANIQPYFTQHHSSSQPNKRDLIAECFRPIVKHHQAVRARLRVTCAYFNWLYFAYMILSTMLIFSAAMNVNRYVRGTPFPEDVFDVSWSTQLFPHIVQDAFFLGLGICGLYAIIWVPADCTRSFKRFVTRINDLVMAFPQSSYTQSWTHIHPASLAGLTAYYNNSRTAYTLFGSPITFTFFVVLILLLSAIMFFALWLVNL